MSYLLVAPEIMTSVAADVGRIGDSLAAGNAAAAASTTTVLTAAGDEVSAAVAAPFSRHAQGYQAIAAQAEAFHGQFLRALDAGAGSYVAAEAANASPLQLVIDAAGPAAQTLLSRPIIGNGANATTPGGNGGNGGNGGLLFGFGGAGRIGGAGTAGGGMGGLGGHGGNSALLIGGGGVGGAAGGTAGAGGIA